MTQIRAGYGLRGKRMYIHTFYQEYYSCIKSYAVKLCINKNVETWEEGRKKEVAEKTVPELPGQGRSLDY